MDIDDVAACYRAVASRDRRFDGMIYTAVRTTGIYCRPSCPARTPAPANVTFHRTAAAAQAAGYRACKRCLPDAAPGSPAWDVTADTAGRAMRLIADGVVERDGVGGLAGRLGYTARHLNRLLTAEVGAGPLALARAQRAQNARLLIERTDWLLGDVAFAAGFRSLRQFNATMREVYGTTPTALRGRRPSSAAVGGAARLDVRLPVRAPFDARALWSFLDAHVVAGVEATGVGWYARSIRLPRGPGTVRIELADVAPAVTGVVQVPCTVRVTDLRDVPTAIERCRRLLDADCDPVAVDGALSADSLLARLVAAHPGLRVPGHVDGDELALRTVLGQQVSVARGNRLAAGLALRCGDRLPEPLVEAGVERLFPSPGQVAAVDPASLPMPRARSGALVGLAAVLANGGILLDRSAERTGTRERLLAVPGIGAWTADYVAMRALGDPDVFLPTDVAARRALRTLGVTDPVTRSAGWRPWRSYALLHLWTSLTDDKEP